jgi:hypothetical protein
MAKRTIVTEELVDDLDGSPGERTVHFTWDGIAYEIDLSKRNLAAFEKALKPYVDAARRVRGGASTRTAPAAVRELAAVRQWAAQNGYAISGRGRIASSVLEAYTAAQRG